MSDPPVTDSRKASVVNGDNGEVETGEDLNVEDDDTEKELSNVIGNGTEEDVLEPDDNFRSLLISPVPTPLLYRPETREMTRLSVAESMQHVLNGHVHRRCPPDDKIIKLCVMGGYTGKHCCFI